VAEAVRCRIDFKYALAMELDDPGFHHSVLSDFRDRIAAGGRADELLDLTLQRLKAAGLVKTGDGSAPTPPTSWPPPATSAGVNPWRGYRVELVNPGPGSKDRAHPRLDVRTVGYAPARYRPQVNHRRGLPVRQAVWPG
jgi:hypothetical protein